MALDKNDGTFIPSIDGVISGKTSQVTGMNGLLNDLMGNDNYLKDKKLDRGNYNGTAERLHTDSDAIWGGLDGGGRIEDSTVVKEVGKRYIGADGKAYICRVPSNINNLDNYTPCNVVDNLGKIQTLFYYKKQSFSYFNFPMTIERIGKICIISISSKTPNQKNGIIPDIPNWALPLSDQCGALTGDNATLATGEMYIRVSGEFEFFVNRIDEIDLYTGQIIYIAKN
ncbi:MAG: hypothetical protein ACRCW1_03060 [Anaerotignaceae bacterium]